ncbi:uncharacterized protein LOC143028982 [Oratosquilla oratoria]|uniref:uncharacterized protein LOC143028982 n=1 Tax=Oratosquilla oratoria TaxID=337810 RepID=UPI003F75D1D8
MTQGQWKFGVLIVFASVVLHRAAAQGGAESIPFPGHIPGEHVRASSPEGDDHPNDVYSHLAVRAPLVSDDQVVIYPHNFLGSEYGKDPEDRVYQIRASKSLDSSEGHSKHDKKHKAHGKEHHHHKSLKGAHAEHLGHITAGHSSLE